MGCQRRRGLDGVHQERSLGGIWIACLKSPACVTLDSSCPWVTWYLPHQGSPKGRDNETLITEFWIYSSGSPVSNVPQPLFPRLSYLLWLSDPSSSTDPSSPLLGFDSRTRTDTTIQKVVPVPQDLPSSGMALPALSLNPYSFLILL